jgi:hypothetical protein
MRAPAAALHVRGSGPPGSPRPFLHGTGARGGRGRSICGGWGAATAWRRTFPATDAATRLPWRSRIDPAEQVAEFIQRRSPSRRAHLVGLSLAAWWRTRCRLDARSCWIGW